MGLDMWLNNSKDENVITWRKANQIRGWFVDKGIIQDDDNCVQRPVTQQDINDLVDDCKTVLADHSKAEELLPPTSGFFFGSEEFDKWYYEDLQMTVEKLEPLKEKDDHYIYEDWW